MQQHQQYQKNQKYQKYNKWNSTDCIQGIFSAITVRFLILLNEEGKQVRIPYTSQKDQMRTLIQSYQNIISYKFKNPKLMNLEDKKYFNLWYPIQIIIELCKQKKIQIVQGPKQQIKKQNTKPDFKPGVKLQSAKSSNLKFSENEKIAIRFRQIQKGITTTYQSFAQFYDVFYNISNKYNYLIYIQNIKKSYYIGEIQFSNLKEIYSKFCYQKKQELVLELFQDKYLDSVKVKQNKNFDKIFIEMVTGKEKEKIYQIQKFKFKTIQDIKKKLVQQMKEPDVNKIEDIILIYDGKQLQNQRSLDYYFLKLSNYQTYISLHIKERKVKVNPQKLTLTVYQIVHQDQKINKKIGYQYTYNQFKDLTVGALMRKIRQKDQQQGFCLMYQEEELMMPNKQIKQIFSKQDFYEYHIEMVLVEKHQRVIFYKTVQDINFENFTFPQVKQQFCISLMNKSTKKIKKNINQKLTREQFYLPLQYYTLPDKFFKQINNQLKNLTIFDLQQYKNEQDFKLGCKLIRSLNKLSPFFGQVHRGMTEYKLSLNYKEGQIFVFKNFTSTSKKQQVAKSFFNAPQNQCTLFHINSYTGKYIENFTTMPGQDEVLFAPFTYFYIEKIKQKSDKGQYEQVWLTECPTSKMNFKNIVIWIDDKHDKNQQHSFIFNQILNKHPKTQVLLYSNNKILQKWLQQFKYMIFKKCGQIKFVSNMVRIESSITNHKAGVQTIKLCENFGLLIPTLFYVGNQDLAKKNLEQDQTNNQFLYYVSASLPDFLNFCNFEDNEIIQKMKNQKDFRLQKKPMQGNLSLLLLENERRQNAPRQFKRRIGQRQQSDSSQQQVINWNEINNQIINQKKQQLALHKKITNQYNFQNRSIRYTQVQKIFGCLGSATTYFVYVQTLQGDTIKIPYINRQENLDYLIEKYKKIKNIQKKIDISLINKNTEQVYNKNEIIRDLEEQFSRNVIIVLEIQKEIIQTKEDMRTTQVQVTKDIEVTLPFVNKIQNEEQFSTPEPEKYPQIPSIQIYQFYPEKKKLTFGSFIEFKEQLQKIQRRQGTQIFIRNTKQSYEAKKLNIDRLIKIYKRKCKAQKDLRLKVLNTDFKKYLPKQAQYTQILVQNINTRKIIFIRKNLCRTVKNLKDHLAIIEKIQKSEDILLYYSFQQMENGQTLGDFGLNLPGKKPIISMIVKGLKILQIRREQICVTIHEKTLYKNRLENKMLLECPYQYIKNQKVQYLVNIICGNDKKHYCFKYKNKFLLPNQKLKQIQENIQFTSQFITIQIVENYSSIVFYNEVKNFHNFDRQECVFEQFEYKIFIASQKNNIQQRIHNQTKLDPFIRNEEFYFPLYYYTTDNYKEINKNLRSIKLQDWKYQNPRILNIVSSIIKRLNQLPQYIGKVYRGMKNFTFSDFYKEKSIIFFENFTSSTIDQKVAQRFMESQNKSLLHINSLSGKKIDYFSWIPGQRQVLFLPYTYFHVDKIIVRQINQKEGKKYEEVWLTQLSSLKSSQKNLILFIDDKPKAPYSKKIRNQSTEIYFFQRTQIAEKWLIFFKWLLSNKAKIRIMTNMVRKEQQRIVPNYYAGADLLKILYDDYLFSLPALVYCEDEQTACKNINQRQLKNNQLLIAITKNINILHTFCNFQNSLSYVKSFIFVQDFKYIQYNQFNKREKQIEFS